MDGTIKTMLLDTSMNVLTLVTMLSKKLSLPPEEYWLFDESKGHKVPAARSMTAEVWLTGGTAQGMGGWLNPYEPLKSQVDENAVLLLARKYIKGEDVDESNPLQINFLYIQCRSVTSQMQVRDCGCLLSSPIQGQVPAGRAGMPVPGGGHARGVDTADPLRQLQPGTLLGPRLPQVHSVLSVRTQDILFISFPRRNQMKTLMSASFLKVKSVEKDILRAWQQLVGTTGIPLSQPVIDGVTRERTRLLTGRRRDHGEGQVREHVSLYEELWRHDVQREGGRPSRQEDADRPRLHQ